MNCRQFDVPAEGLWNLVRYMCRFTRFTIRSSDSMKVSAKQSHGVWGWPQLDFDAVRLFAALWALTAQRVSRMRHDHLVYVQLKWQM
jgi:hypothetical protein